MSSDAPVEIKLSGREELIERGICPERGCKTRHVRVAMYSGLNPPSEAERNARLQKSREHLESLEKHGMCPACASK